MPHRRDPVMKIGDWGPGGFIYSGKLFSDTTFTVTSPMTGCAHATERN